MKFLKFTVFLIFIAQLSWTSQISSAQKPHVMATTTTDSAGLAPQQVGNGCGQVPDYFALGLPI